VRSWGSKNCWCIWLQELRQRARQSALLDAAVKAMEQVTAPVIRIALVLSAVFPLSQCSTRHATAEQGWDEN
jgi:hypothetical protein